jgi:hypothetical protein
MKPQPSPGNLRSSRNRALEIGAAREGFPDNAAGPYNPQAGTPADAAGGNYGADTAHTKDPGPPVNPATPFKLGQ